MDNRKWLERINRVKVLARIAAGVAALPLLSQGELVHRWSFNDGTARDSVGLAHGTLYAGVGGTAVITNGCLSLSGSNGTNRMESAAFNHVLTNKTLVAWCTLEDPSARYSGSALSVADGKFDGIVYAERKANQWMNGSEGFLRTPADNGGASETLADPNEIMMAITYDKNLPSNQIKLYRNGSLYAQVTPANPVTNFLTTTKAVIGPRYVAWQGYLNGKVNEARVYDTALSAAEISALYAEGPNPVADFSNAQLLHRWSFDDGTAADSVGTANGTLYGTAAISDGRLRLSGSSGVNRMETASFGHVLTNKTLVSWCTLADSRVRYKGSVLSVRVGGCFDGIVYAENATNQWRNGSDMGYRTGGSGADETLSDPGEIMMAIVHDSAAANKIKIYRNGALYLLHNPAAITNFPTTASVVIGPRCSTAEGYLDGTVNEARVYGTALTPLQIAALYESGPDRADGVWARPAGGGWDRGTNWTANVIAGGIGRTADFGALDIITDTPVSLNGPRTVGRLAFGDTSASHDWFLSPGTGGTLTLAATAGTPEIAVSNQTAVVAVSLSGTSGFKKTGAGTLTLAATNTYSGATVVSEGTLKLGDTLAHRWSFDDGTANDSVGAAHGTLYGTATVSGGRLRLSGSASANRMETAAFGHTVGPDKTLVSWCTLADSAVRYKGSVLTVMSADALKFDGIVYAERVTNQWMNGSDNGLRTADGGVGETLSDPNEIMMAITYESGAANKIKLYRNGALYNQYNPANPLTNLLASAKAIIGPRHVLAGYIDGTVNEARVYRTALTAEQIATLAAAGPVYTAPSNLLPTGTVVSVASGAALDLSNYSQTVAGLSGSGLVTNSAALTVTGTLTPGDSAAAPSALTVNSNLTLSAGATLAYDYNTVTADVARVTGTLAVQGANTVEISAIGAAPLPNRMTLFTFGALAGAENLGSWTVQAEGLAGKQAKVRSDAASLYVTISPSGTLIRVL